MATSKDINLAIDMRFEGVAAHPPRVVLEDADGRVNGVNTECAHHLRGHRCVAVGCRPGGRVLALEGRSTVDSNAATFVHIDTGNGSISVHSYDSTADQLRSLAQTIRPALISFPR